MEIEFSQQTFEKYTNMKFHEDPFSGNTDDPYGRTDITSNNKLFIMFYFMCVLFTVSSNERAACQDDKGITQWDIFGG